MTGVLVVMNNNVLAGVVCQTLQTLDYGAVVLGDAAAASRHYDRCHPDAVLVEMDHPYGWDLVRRFYQRGDAPVLALVNDEDEVILALEQGADDALILPFAPRTLVARLKARLRRPGSPTLPVPTTEGLDFVRCGPVLIDLPRYSATLYNAPLDLSPLEFDLLVLFARTPQHMFTKQEVFERVWRTRYIEGDRSVDSAMLRLRRKLGNFGDALETVRGKGYRLVWKQEQAASRSA
jgi:DNA-binding response OmpR family regulator